MDSSILAISAMSFVLSFIFALGGVGSALVLIPAITWIGLPFAEARSIGLFVNGVSMMGATWSNIRQKRLDIRLGLPIIIASILLAPFGAWVGLHIPVTYVMYAFVTFLSFSGLMILFFNGSKFKDQYREDRPVTGPFFTGVCSGFLSGLLGVGGGGLISPLMILQGFNPKKVATVTAFAVPFSSFTAFLAYASMGSVSWEILGFVGVSAWIGGYFGTVVMQKNMRPAAVRKFLGVMLLLLAARMIQKMFT
ncbi:sulfite exporter TauE/SafE family protein [Desulforhopalus sp. 52FAK]